MRWGSARQRTRQETGGTLQELWAGREVNPGSCPRTSTSVVVTAGALGLTVSVQILTLPSLAECPVPQVPHQ